MLGILSVELKAFSCSGISLANSLWRTLIPLLHRAGHIFITAQKSFWLMIWGSIPNRWTVAIWSRFGMNTWCSWFSCFWGKDSHVFDWLCFVDTDSSTAVYSVALTFSLPVCSAEGSQMNSSTFSRKFECCKESWWFFCHQLSHA